MTRRLSSSHNDSLSYWFESEYSEDYLIVGTILMNVDD